jgi:hypothetical protein
VVLLEELRHVHDQVADDRQARQRTQRDRLLQAVNVGQAGQAVLAVDVHRVGAAHAFAAGTAEGHRVILGTQADQRVEQLLVGRLELDRDVLHVGLLVLVRIVAVDLEMNGTLAHDLFLPDAQ